MAYYEMMMVPVSSVLSWPMLLTLSAAFLVILSFAIAGVFSDNLGAGIANGLVPFASKTAPLSWYDAAASVTVPPKDIRPYQPMPRYEVIPWRANEYIIVDTSAAVPVTMRVVARHDNKADAEIHAAMLNRLDNWNHAIDNMPHGSPDNVRDSLGNDARATGTAGMG